MGIFLWIAVGLAAGAVAKMAMPGPDPLGTTGRALLGIGGAIAGGLLGALLSGGSLTGMGLYGSLTALIGALGVLFGYRCVAMRALE